MELKTQVFSVFPKAPDTQLKRELHFNENIPSSQCTLNYNFKSQSFSFLTDVAFEKIFKS